MDEYEKELKEVKEKIRKLYGGKLPSIRKITEDNGKKLAFMCAQKSFELFNDKIFRALADFEHLPQTERDRIYNELVLAGLIMMIFTLEAPDLNVDGQTKQYFADIKERISEGYVLNLKEMGIEKKFLDMWKTLIKMRYDEYSKDKFDIRKAAMDLESKTGELTVDKLNDIQLLLPVNTIAIGAHHHIVRGKTKGRDELFKYLLKWLGRFYVDFRVAMERGKAITPLERLFVKAKRFLRKVFS